MTAAIALTHEGATDDALERTATKVERAGHEFVARGDGRRWGGVECRRCGGEPAQFYVGRGEFSPCPSAA